MASPIENLFMQSWRAGIIFFDMHGNTSILEDGFTTASNLCSKDDNIQKILRDNRILLDRIVERKAPTDIQTLEKMGADLAQLIVKSEGTLPPQ